MTTRLLALCALVCAVALPAHADLVKQNAGYSKTVLVLDTNGNNATGLTTASFTATASKAGAVAVSITTPTITEIGSGKYSIALPATLTNTLGALDVTLTAAGTIQTDSHDQIVAFDPNSDLGASALATANTGITNANNGIAANASSLGAVLGGQSSISAQINALPNVSAIASAVKGNPAPTWLPAPLTTQAIVDAFGNNTPVSGGGAGVLDCAANRVYANGLYTDSGQSLGGLIDKLFEGIGPSLNGVQGAVDASNTGTGVNVLQARISQALVFTGANVNANAQVLPSPAPSGYGGSGGGVTLAQIQALLPPNFVIMQIDNVGRIKPVPTITIGH